MFNVGSLSFPFVFAEDANGVCPPDFQELKPGWAHEFCYKLDPTIEMFDFAQAVCEEQSAKLAVPTNEDVFNKLTEWIG